MNNVIANILIFTIVAGSIFTMLDKRITRLKCEILRNKEDTEGQLVDMKSEIHKVTDGSSVKYAHVMDKIEAINRELRGETYIIELLDGVYYGGFEKNGKPSFVDYDKAVLMTHQEAERIKKMLGTGAIFNRTKTILKDLEKSK